MRRFTFLCVFFLTVFLCIPAGCADASGTGLQKRFGSSAYYFLGIKNLQEGSETQARRYFLKGAKKHQTILARKCMEALTYIGDAEERIKAAERYAAEYPDTEAKLRAAQEYDSSEKYEAIITLTENLAYDAPDALIRLRLSALAAERNSLFAQEAVSWFFSRPVSQEHTLFFTAADAAYVSEVLPDDILQLIMLRLSVYKRDYAGAFRQLSQLLEQQQNPAGWLSEQPEQILSDAGKTFLYGSTNYAANAVFLDAAAAAAEKAEQTSIASFFTRFYAGRLYDRASAGSMKTAADRYEQAMQAAPSDRYYDNALWYYFSIQLKISTAAAETALKTYIQTIIDPAYYADFFDTLCVKLFSARDWQSMYRIYQIIEPYADAESVSRYAYLCGRLIEEKLLVPPQTEDGQHEQITYRLFSRAYEPGGILYYRMLAGYRLAEHKTEPDTSLYLTQLRTDFEPEAVTELLLQGYAAYGLPEFIYPEWQKDPLSVSIAAAAQAADFLSSSEDPEYRSQGLRIMSNAIYRADTQPDEHMYKTAYPRLFSAEISEASTRYGLSEYILYALIRSESFFDPFIMSHAGAIGLAQLMAPTAADIARKLKMSDYNLEDARTNIHFGAFYLEELTRRLDGSVLDALFAYNGGITRVRSWKKSAARLPPDLFLETVPFSETREYGRKVVSAAVLYGMLYYNKPADSVIEEIMLF